MVLLGKLKEFNKSTPLIVFFVDNLCINYVLFVTKTRFQTLSCKILRAGGA